MSTKLAILNANIYVDFIFSAIADNEKREIKCMLLSDCFKEPVPQIATQMAVLIGNISRMDYPHDWNEVRTKRLPCEDNQFQNRLVKFH